MSNNLYSNRVKKMDKRDYIIIGLLVVIIAMLAYGVYNSYVDSQPETFDLGDFKVAGPAGSHYHKGINDNIFYLGENESMPVFEIGEMQNFSANDFKEMIDVYNKGEISKTEIIKSFNEGIGSDVSMKALDFNVGDFRGEPEVSILCQNPYDGTKTMLMHMVLHNNDKTYLVLEFMDNPVSTSMYNSLILK